MTEKQRIIIFGGTGNCGPFVVQRAVDDGYDVYAFVRTSSKLSAELRQKIHIIKGDALDAEAVAAAIEGKDAVLSLLGASFTLGPTTLVSEGTRNIVLGMKKYGVKKIAVMVGVVSMPGAFQFFLFRHVAADHRRIVKFLKEEYNDLDWVMIHSSFVERSPKVNPGYLVEKSDYTGRLFVTAGEIGDLMLKCIGSANAEYRHYQLGVSSGPGYVTTFQMKLLAVSILLAFVGVVMYGLGFF